jgi:hypothetical protein
VFRRHEKAPSVDEQRHDLEQYLLIARDFEGHATGDDQVPIPVVLQRGERMFTSMNGAALVEPRRGPGHWEGRSQGVSVHVPGTKSMRYRVGASKGTFVQGVESPTAIDSGVFTLTTTRAVFVGSKQTREWLWAKLISVTHASDASWTVIAVSNRQKASGVAYDAAQAERVRFWIDLAVSDATGTRDELVAHLENELRGLEAPGT